MKKIALLIVTFVLTSAMAFSQSSHFTFRDIPIDGTIEEMGSKLKQIGYTPTEYTYALNGKFIDEDCTLFLMHSEYTKKVYSIAINFEKADTWAGLKSSFNRVCELCTTKYGNPIRTARSFKSPYYEGDGYEMTAVRTNNCNYNAKWETNEGKIILGVLASGALVMYYTDLINDKLNDDAKKKVAESEI